MIVWQSVYIAAMQCSIPFIAFLYAQKASHLSESDSTPQTGAVVTCSSDPEIVATKDKGVTNYKVHTVLHVRTYV